MFRIKSDLIVVLLGIYTTDLLEFFYCIYWKDWNEDKRVYFVFITV